MRIEEIPVIVVVALLRCVLDTTVSIVQLSRLEFAITNSNRRCKTDSYRRGNQCITSKGSKRKLTLAKLDKSIAILHILPYQLESFRINSVTTIHNLHERANKKKVSEHVGNERLRNIAGRRWRRSYVNLAEIRGGSGRGGTRPRALDTVQNRVVSIYAKLRRDTATLRLRSFAPPAF